MPDKQKILLAVGERALEKILKNELMDEFTFVKEASYREIVIQRIREEQPDIILLREALKGSMPIDNLVLDIRQTFPKIRVIFYTKKYRPGEPLLRRLVSYGVYDFIGGESVTKKQIFQGLRVRKQLSDVRQFLDAPEIVSEAPVMLVTTEYKDLEEPKMTEEVKPIPQKMGKKKKEATIKKQPDVPKETKELNVPEMKEKGLLKRLFPFGHKKNNVESDNEAPDPTVEAALFKDDDFILKVKDAPEEERSFWGESDTTHAPEVDDAKPKVAFQSPMPFFHQKEVLEKEELRKEEVAEPLEDVKVSEDPLVNEQAEQEKERISAIQKRSAPAIEVSTPVVDETPDEIEEEEEEDLFGTPTTPVDESPVGANAVEEVTQPSPKLTFKPRGKPNMAADDLALHRQETLNEPEIDFNPMDVDGTNRAHIDSVPKVEQPTLDSVAPIEHNEDASEGWSGRKTTGTIKVANKRIVTFVGATHGVGNTHVAFNAAVKLAEEGNRVLYMEAHSVFSSIDFSMQLGTWQQGIEKALEDIEYNQGMNVGDHILRIKELKQNAKHEKALKKLYKPLPDTLDYMFYSQDYQTLEEQHAVPKERLKDLVMYLLTREKYDVIIVDSEPVGSAGVDGLLNISSKVYFTMTQDPAQMGVFHRQFDATQNRIKITDNRYIIVNQFVKTEPTVKRIQKWTNERVLQTVPFTHKDVVTANFLGVPFILRTKHQSAINAFDSLIEHIAE